MLFAQSTFAAITGTVRDPTGAPVSSAALEVTNTGTGYKYTGATDVSGRVIVGPGTHVLHMNLAKVTTIRERIRLRTELVATNATNQPNYVDPNQNITDLAGAGVITNVVNRNNKLDMAIPRLLQLVLRVQR